MRGISLLTVVLLAGCRSYAQAPVTVTLDPSVKHQTVRGWSCNPWYRGIAPKLRDQLLDEAINELGLTRVRWQQANGNRSAERSWEAQNDDGDPDTTNWDGFLTADADRAIETWVVPFKQRVEANGEPFELWMSPSFFDGGSTGTVPAWLLHSPGEYAEYALAYVKHMKDKHGVEATHYVICNEAGNNNAFSPQVVIEMTEVLGERLAAAGLKTKGQFSDGVNAGVTWRYLQAARDAPEIWKYVDVLSYHWYGGNNQESMAKIRDFAREKGIDTGQTEFMGLTMNHLYDDLTIGGTSYWCLYGLAGPGRGGHNFGLSLANTSFTRGAQFWNFRQVMHYVRPGAVRIEATSDAPAVRSLAFVRNGKTTVVLISQQACTVSVTNLPDGDYGVSQSAGTQPYQERGVRRTEGGAGLTVDLPANAVLTIYPHPGKNLPPTVTNWQANPEFLTEAGKAVKLSASAQDPEVDALSFAWSVASQPAGAAAVLATPDAATTDATGLTATGQYVFTVSVSDGTNAVKREVMLTVYAGNQPPVTIDVHNRLPVMVTLPQTVTELRGGGFDLDGDKLTFKWSLVSQPAGAAANLESPTEQKCKLSNLTVPGEYVVQLDVSDATHTVPSKLSLTVWPENQAPAIDSLVATPAALAPPASEVSLSAKTSDPGGDVLTHWWRVKSAPPGAKIAFSKQGGCDTKVSGLTVAGVYVFSLTAVDRTLATRKDVTVTVGAAPAGPVAEGLTEPPPERRKGDELVIARGKLVGAVVAKGRAWVDIRSPSGKVERYIPRWIGGMPRDGGGPEGRTVQALSQLQVGGHVSVEWYVNDHLRIENIQPAP
jgi:hypothetical protein